MGAFLLALVLLACVAHGSAVNTTSVFTKDERYDCYKIPYLMQTRTGKLLAFTEARGPFDAPEGTSTGDCMDWDITDLVMRTSTDGGQTWSNLTTVIPGRYGKHTVAGNMAIVQDDITGRILLPFNRGNVEMWMSYSDDDGQTWQKPYRMVDNEHALWTWVGFGPPGGIQLQSDPNSQYYGRLVVPGYYSTFPVYDNGLATVAFMLYSDDHGETWQQSQDVPNGFLGLLRGVAGNENQIVELSDGTILCNSRTIYGNRIQATSKDGGVTWSTFEKTSLPNPLVGCEGSIAAESSDRLLYSGTGGPNDSVARTLMTVWESADNGATWDKLIVLEDEGAVSYSSLFRMLDGQVAILYELSAEVETVFVPGDVVFAIVPTGRAPVPRTLPATTQLLPNTTYDMDWQKDDGDAEIFVYSGSWYVIQIVNGFLAPIALVLFIMAGLCPCCCCCVPAGRKLAAACSKNDNTQPEDPEAQNDSQQEQEQQDKAPLCGGPDVNRKAVMKAVGLWALKSLLVFNLGFWIVGVLGSFLFSFDDATRWTMQCLFCMAGLFGSIVVSSAVLLWRRQKLAQNPKVIEA